MYVFFDTETTGLPKNYKAPASDINNWPRLVQLGYIVYDLKGNIITSGNHIIKPSGFTIPIESSNVHGITTEIALRDGKNILSVIDEFISYIEKADYLIAHNMAFDEKIIGAELIRHNYSNIIETKNRICTMLTTVNYCAISGNYGYKWPKLSELHIKLFGLDFDNAHNAFSDIEATAKCFWRLKELGIISLTKARTKFEKDNTSTTTQSVPTGAIEQLVPIGPTDLGERIRRRLKEELHYTAADIREMGHKESIRVANLMLTKENRDAEKVAIDNLEKEVFQKDRANIIEEIESAFINATNLTDLEYVEDEFIPKLLGSPYGISGREGWSVYGLDAAGLTQLSKQRRKDLGYSFKFEAIIPGSPIQLKNKTKVIVDKVTKTEIIGRKKDNGETVIIKKVDFNTKVEWVWTPVMTADNINEEETLTPDNQEMIRCAINDDQKKIQKKLLILAVRKAIESNKPFDIKEYMASVYNRISTKTESADLKHATGLSYAVLAPVFLKQIIDKIDNAIPKLVSIRFDFNAFYILYGQIQNPESGLKAVADYLDLTSVVDRFNVDISHEIDMTAPLTIDSLQLLMDAYCPSRKRDFNETEILLKELKAFDITLISLSEACQSVKIYLPSIEYQVFSSSSNKGAKFSQVGIIREVMMLTNNSYLISRKLHIEMFVFYCEWRMVMDGDYYEITGRLRNPTYPIFIDLEIEYDDIQFDDGIDVDWTGNDIGPSIYD